MMFTRSYLNPVISHYRFILPRLLPGLLNRSHDLIDMSLFRTVLLVHNISTCFYWQLSPFSLRYGWLSCLSSSWLSLLLLFQASPKMATPFGLKTKGLQSTPKKCWLFLIFQYSTWRKHVHFMVHEPNRFRPVFVVLSSRPSCIGECYMGQGGAITAPIFQETLRVAIIL